MRAPATRALALAVAAVVVAGLVQPAGAKSRVTPGNFTGYAFDTCDAPSQQKMNDWLRSSKFWGVGIYIAGMNRACDAQPNLTRRWVARQAANGWRVLPIVVGRQASCAPKGYYRKKRISDAPRNNYAAARTQGRQAARSGVDAARRLGIGRGSVIWYDLEHFDTGKRRCRRSALSFTSAWTTGLHRLGYRSGFYSSASSGIDMVDDARRSHPRRYDLPDYLWVAEWNGRDNLRSAYISKAGWWPHRRVHQYRGDHTERHGGSAITIDSNVLSTGRGTLAGPRGRICGLRIGYRDYPRLERGERGRKVRVAQCLLRRQGPYDGELHGHYTRGLTRAVRRFQRSSPGIGATGTLNRATWTALLAVGRTPLTKVGSGGDEVRRLQRALNAATGAHLRLDGVFGRSELRVVRYFQRQAGLSRTGVVTDEVWRALRRGRAVPRVVKLSDLGLSSLLESLPGPVPVPFSSGIDHR